MQAVCKTDLRADTQPCPCGRSGSASKGRSRAVTFGECCGPLLQGKQFAVDAEALMRSRYWAYVHAQLDYLRATWHPSTCPADLDAAPATRWLGLEIRHHEIDSDGEQGQVEFIARYRLDGRGQRLHEHSQFVREEGRWFYVSGEFLN